jgi:hypothetical protein
MRKVGLLAGFVGALVLAVGALVVPAGAGQEPPEDAPTTIIIRKVVLGPATEGSAITISCGDGDIATLTFDKTGAPDTASVGSFSKVDGAWVLFTDLPDDPTPCTFTETANGATTTTLVDTSWTCAYESTEPDIVKGQGLEAPEPGCAAAAGNGPGPVTVTYGNFDTDVETQTSTVTFTNTYVAPAPLPLDLAPNFTG